MNEDKLNLKKSKILNGNGKKLFQIDLLKAIMILLVIIDHSLVYSMVSGLGFQLWERIAIPMFLIIMGFNMGKSFKREGNLSLRELYSWSYFKKKFWRYIYPYLILYFVGTIFGFILYGVAFPATFKENWLLEYVLFQKALLEGPGNWFIPVVFQSIFLMPLLYKAFSKWPKLMLILCFMVEFLMHLIVFFIIGESTVVNIAQEVYFRNIIFLYLSAFGMGIWFSVDHNLFSKRNLFVWILFPFSLLYMIVWDFFNFRLAIDGATIVRGDYNYITFIYSALLFLIAIKFLSQNPKSKLAKGISIVGGSTFHIFLTQDIYFAISYIMYDARWILTGDFTIVNILGIATNDLLTNFLLIILNWLICIFCGVFWWYTDQKIKNIRLGKKNLILNFLTFF